MTRRSYTILLLAGTLLFSLGWNAGDAHAASRQTRVLKMQADLLLKEGKTERAIPLYERALRGDRSFANAYYNLATAHYLRGEARKAEQNLEFFVRLRPRDSEALYNLGCLKLRAGNFEGAQKCFQTARDCNSSPVLCQKIREALLFMKDLHQENPETQNLVASLLTL